MWSQYNTTYWTNWPTSNGAGLQNTPSDVERVPQHDGHRRARPPQAAGSSQRDPLARRTASAAARPGAGAPPVVTARADWSRPADGDRVTRYFARKIAPLPADVLRRRHDRLGDPAVHAGRPDRRPGQPDSRPTRRPAQELARATSRSRSGSTSRSGSSTSNFWRGLLHGDLGPSIAYVGSPVSELIWARAPVHAGAARPGDRAQLHRRQPGRRDGRPAEVARQHRAAGRLRAHGDAVHVARDRARLLPRVPVGHLPRLRRLRLLAAAGLDVGVRAELPQPLVPAVPVAVPRLVRRLGDRDAQPDHLRARGRLLQLPPGARRPERLVRQVRLPQRRAAADDRPRARARRGRRRRPRDRDRLRLPGHRHADHHGAPEPRLLPAAGHLPVHHHRRPDRQLHRRHRST